MQDVPQLLIAGAIWLGITILGPFITARFGPRHNRPADIYQAGEKTRKALSRVMESPWKEAPEKAVTFYTADLLLGEIRTLESSLGRLVVAGWAIAAAVLVNAVSPALFG